MIKQKQFFSIILTLILTTISAQNAINQFDNEGKRHGAWQKKYPNTDQLRYKGQFNHGKEIDTFKYYKLKNQKSVLSAVKIYNSKNSLANVIFYTSNKKVVSKGQMNGKHHIGTWTYYHKNSNKLMIEEYYNANGKLEGKRLVYYKNGNIADCASYLDDELNGILKRFSENNVLLQESMYVNNKLNGRTVYYENLGDIKAEGNYKSNLKVGIWSYYKEGEIVKKINHNTNEIVFEK